MFNSLPFIWRSQYRDCGHTCWRLRASDAPARLGEAMHELCLDRVLSPDALYLGKVLAGSAFFFSLLVQPSLSAFFLNLLVQPSLSAFY